MSIELKVPDVGESVREVQIGRWLKREGDSVERDENLVELETDKASLELPAPAAGVMGKILKREGDVVTVGDVIGYVEKDGAAPRDKAEHPKTNRSKNRPKTIPLQRHANGPTPRPRFRKRKQPASKQTGPRAPLQPKKSPATRTDDVSVTPSARRALRDHGLAAADVRVSGPRIDRDDVLRYVKEHDEHARGRRHGQSKAIPKESKTGNRASEW